MHTSEVPEADVLRPQQQAKARVINTSVPAAGILGNRLADPCEEGCESGRCVYFFMPQEVK